MAHAHFIITPGRNTLRAFIDSRHAARQTLRVYLLLGGILSSVLYLLMNIIVPMRWPAYDSASQTISELSAIGAPTRTLWMWLSIPYTLLVTGFGWGVWMSAPNNKRLRIAGILLFAYGALGILWPFAPMHVRETIAAGGSTFSDTLHIALGVVTEMLYLFALFFTAAALGKKFLVYSALTFIVLLIFVTMTFLDAPGIAKNEPTPFIGIWERINIGVFMLWSAVLALDLLRGPADYIEANYETRAAQPTWQRVILLFVLGYEGLGGLAGGSFLLATPNGSSMDMPVSILHGYFPDFQIPGFILLGLGLLNIIAFFFVLRKSWIDWIVAGIALGGFIAWFGVEIAVLQELHWLHAMWGLPVLIGALATLSLIPTKIYSNIWNNTYETGL